MDGNTSNDGNRLEKNKELSWTRWLIFRIIKLEKMRDFKNKCRFQSQPGVDHQG